MRIVLLISFKFFLLTSLYGQKVDTIISTGIYKSYFCFEIKNPLYVTYSLYQGGGDCNRSAQGLTFKLDGVPQTASKEDYSHSNYEKGHLANAEDFASDCDKEEKTFRFYNCLPQTGRLNKGIWKVWETSIRKESQKKKLFIIAGGIFGKKFIGLNVAVPDYCYKIVLDSRTKKILHCIIFKNDNSDVYTNITLANLKKKLGYGLVP